MQLVDTQASASERHTIMDFTAGRNFGIGLFGSGGTGTVGAGVRAAQFDTRADAAPEVEPIWVDDTDPSITVSGIPRVGFIQTMYDGTTHEQRSFHGIGPELTWDATQPVLGTPANGQVTLDWGINAAMLFGRQNVRIDQTMIERHIYWGANQPADTQSLSTQPYSRSRRVTVPNLGGYVGLSARYRNAKISLGYRADEFFNVMDGGQATAKNYDRGFYGPYLNLSLGFGG